MFPCVKFRRHCTEKREKGTININGTTSIIDKSLYLVHLSIYMFENLKKRLIRGSFITPPRRKNKITEFIILSLSLSLSLSQNNTL